MASHLFWESVSFLNLSIFLLLNFSCECGIWGILKSFKAFNEIHLSLPVLSIEPAVGMRSPCMNLIDFFEKRGVNIEVKCVYVVSGKEPSFAKLERLSKKDFPSSDEVHRRNFSFNFSFHLSFCLPEIINETEVFLYGRMLLDHWAISVWEVDDQFLFVHQLGAQ